MTSTLQFCGINKTWEPSVIHPNKIQDAMILAFTSARKAVDSLVTSYVSIENNIRHLDTPIIIPTTPASNTVYNDGTITITVAGLRGFTMNNPLQKSIKTLEEISQLRDNWNENGAEPFSDQIIKRCISLVEKLSTQPDIFPTAQKSIQFEWYTPFGNYLEIEIFEDGHCSTLKKENNTLLEKKIDFSETGEWIAEFTSKYF